MQLLLDTMRAQYYVYIEMISLALVNAKLLSSQEFSDL